MEITKTKPMYVGVDEVCADWEYPEVKAMPLSNNFQIR